MARTHHVQSARKSPGKCSKCGVTIAAGKPYYWWKFRYGGKHVRCALHPPRQSDLTSSDKLSRAYAAGEAIEDAAGGLRSGAIAVQASLASMDKTINGVSWFFEAYQELKGELETSTSEVQEVSQEYNDSADNIEQTFSSSSTADECREKADALDEWASSMESVETELTPFWSAFDPFFVQAREQGWLSEHLCDTIARALDHAEADATEEAWQVALDFIGEVGNTLRQTEAASILTEAIEGAFDALEDLAGSAETVAGECSI